MQISVTLKSCNDCHREPRILIKDRARLVRCRASTPQMLVLPFLALAYSELEKENPEAKRME